MKKNKSRISLFIEPSAQDIRESKILNADCVEIHTGRFCNLVNDNKDYSYELKKIKKAVILSESALQNDQYKALENKSKIETML